MKIFVALMLLLSIMSYSYLYHQDYYPSIKNMLENPDKYHNTIVSVQGQAINIDEGSFYIRFGDQDIKVLYDSPKAPKLGYADVYGMFHKDGYIEAYDVHLAEYNSIKYIVSFLGFIFFIFIFFKEWKFKKWGFESA